MIRFLCGAAVFFLCQQSLFLWAISPEQPDQPGLLNVTTIEFPDLRDEQRGGRRVPIKVHVPEQQGQCPVVVLSHGGGGNWNANFAQANHLASHGYAVLCLEHVGSNTERMKQGLRFMDNVKAMTRGSSEVLG